MSANYETIRVLGRGSFGTAVLARKCSQAGEQNLHVLKNVDLSQMLPAASKEALQEVEVLKSLDHVNIVAYYSAFIESGHLCIVMEYANGGNLAESIQRRQKKEERRFSQQEALSIFSQSCLALQHIHAKHVLHRDLKSANIFLTMDGNVKLGDFGIAKVLEHTTAKAMTVIGSPSYWAPELCDSLPYGTKADIWSLGVVFYELLTLELPFKAKSLAALIVKIVTGKPEPISPSLCSAAVSRLVKRLLRKDPEKRLDTLEILSLPSIMQTTDMFSTTPLQTETEASSQATSRNPSADSASRGPQACPDPQAEASECVMTSQAHHEKRSRVSHHHSPHLGKQPCPVLASDLGKDPQVYDSVNAHEHSDAGGYTEGDCQTVDPQGEYSHGHFAAPLSPAYDAAVEHALESEINQSLMPLPTLLAQGPDKHKKVRQGKGRSCNQSPDDGYMARIASPRCQGRAQRLPCLLPLPPLDDRQALLKRCNKSATADTLQSGVPLPRPLCRPQSVSAPVFRRRSSRPPRRLRSLPEERSQDMLMFADPQVDNRIPRRSSSTACTPASQIWPAKGQLPKCKDGCLPSLNLGRARSVSPPPTWASPNPAWLSPHPMPWSVPTTPTELLHARVLGGVPTASDLW